MTSKQIGTFQKYDAKRRFVSYKYVDFSIKYFQNYYIQINFPTQIMVNMVNQEDSSPPITQIDLTDE